MTNKFPDVEPTRKPFECPNCGIDWLQAMEMLNAPVGSEAYTMAASILNRCSRLCESYPLYLGTPPLATVMGYWN